MITNSNKNKHDVDSTNSNSTVNTTVNTTVKTAAKTTSAEHHKVKTSPLQIFTSVCAAATLGWLVLGTQFNLTSAQQSNFMGGSPRVENSDAISTLRLVFPAGVRSNWHSHSWGQLLMVESGRGLTQDRGGPLLEMHAGEPWWTPAGREHWHGAHPDEDVLQLTIYEGDVNWLEPVTDAVYHATPQRP